MKIQTTNCESQSQRVLAKIILLGLDVHAESIVVVRQIDGGMPQPAQKFSPAGLLEWMQRQGERAEAVWSCYEAGPFGYRLHRQLEALGVRNLVVCPRDWDGGATGVKTDKSDARALCVRLALYAAGNRSVFSVVRVPTPGQEQTRGQTRLRDQLRRHRQRLEAQGRSLLLAQGYRIRGRWWSERNWPGLSATLPGWLVELLGPLRQCILTAHQQVEHLTQAVEVTATLPRPCGLGALTSEVIGREIGDWRRFSNRRQIASYTGLCPGEHSSGAARRQGRVTKHGNPRLRQALIETAWRLVKYQPAYRAVERWGAVLLGSGSTRAARKKAIVAVARQLAVDLWRIATGRLRAQDLGLVLSQP
jgi:transposase